MQQKLIALLSLSTVLGFAQTAQTAQAGPAADAASAHFQAIARGDLSQLMAAYAADAQLNWVGGPLDGRYQGADNIGQLWQRFAKAQGPLQVGQTELQEAANAKGATVTADVRFTGKQPIDVRYVLTYRAGKIASETWQVMPAPVASAY
ncbi:nuclear transport factor 2 family protein [Pseudomonas sp. MBLB4136]|uniref:nuclear transport factor 2 family protein n=1 Tax=Pseudomonas sp. MBLB4136 TaxID=3451558 RepID=UPI003F7519F0